MASASSSCFVIVTDQMQETVDREMAEMMIERLLLVIGLPARGFIGDGDVAEHARRIVGPARAGRLQGRKRQHVGRLVDAAPVAVEGANAGVVGQHHRKFGFADIRIDESRPRLRWRDGSRLSASGSACQPSATTRTSVMGRAKGAIGPEFLLRPEFAPGARSAADFGIKACWLPAAAAILHRRRRSAPPVRGGSRLRP